MTGEAGRPESGAQVEVTGWAPRGWRPSVCLVRPSWFDVLSLFGFMVPTVLDFKGVPVC